MDNEIIKKQILEVTRNILNKAGFSAEVRIIEGGLGASPFPVVTVESSDDLSILIGKNGQNLSAFEHIVKLIVAQKLADPEGHGRNNFIVDINDYRKSRASYTLELAKNAAQRVISTQRAEALAPMTAYERKLVHTELAGYKEVQTESVGEEPRRRIVIKPLGVGE